ncbi:MAG: substrate-binding domain-containing protein [Acidimicrobiia bacterium]
MFRSSFRARAALVVAAVVALAACGSGDDDTSSTSPVATATPTAAPVDSTAPSVDSTSPSTDASADSSTEETTAGSGPADQVAAARARYEQALLEPTGFVGREVLSSVPEPGKQLIFLRCSLPVCGIIAEAFGNAASVLDWDTSVIDFSSTDPESVIAAFNQAIDQGPDGIAITGLPISAFEEPLERARQAGIPVTIGAVAGVEVGGMDGNGVIGLSSGVNTVVTAANMVGDYMIAESDGTANIAVFTVEDFPIIKAETEGLVQHITENCDGCKVKVINQAVGDIGTVVPGAVVSAVQSDPTIDYVYFAFGDLSRGVGPALADARYEGEIVGYGPITESYQKLIDGEEAAWSGASNRATGWDLIDTLARYFVGDPLSNDDLQLLQLFTSASPPPNENPGIPSNFEELYPILWGLEEE